MVRTASPSCPSEFEDAVVEASEECPGECIFIETRLGALQRARRVAGPR